MFGPNNYGPKSLTRVGFWEWWDDLTLDMFHLATKLDHTDDMSTPALRLWAELDADETRAATCWACGADIYPTRDEQGRKTWTTRFGGIECPERDALLEGPFRGQVPDSLPHEPKTRSGD